ncbi:hypothetical protein NEOLEDRAFT_1073924, partial [Neolentinus lepideus HHB14362 ss-1]
VVYQWYTLGCKTMQIAIDLDMLLRVVQQTLHCWNEIGDVLVDPKRVGRTPILNDTHTQFLIAVLEQSPDLYLDEIADELDAVHGVEVSLAALWQTMKRLGFRAKQQLSKAASERNEEMRLKYGFWIGAESPDWLVFIDESTVDLRTAY